MLSVAHLTADDMFIALSQLVNNGPCKHLVLCKTHIGQSGGQAETFLVDIP